MRRDDLTWSLVPLMELPARPLTVVGLTAARVARDAMAFLSLQTNKNGFSVLDYFSAGGFLMFLRGFYGDTWRSGYLFRDMKSHLCGATWIMHG